MANELRGVSSTGTLYARIMDADGKIYNTSSTSFETYAAGNYTDYDIAMTEQGDSSVYVANFPTGITAGGVYEYYVHRQAGGSPAESDTIVTTGSVSWTGTEAVTAASSAMTASDFRDYILRRGFKRTDKDTEVYEGITDGIQEMRRRFMFQEAHADATTTDTISVLGDFKLDLESDHGLLLDIILQDDDTARKLIRKSKSDFNILYPDINVTNDKGYPEHYAIYDGKIYIGPVPDAVSYTYRLNYSLRAGTIISTTTSVPFTDVFRDVLAYNVLMRLYTDLEEFQKASIYEDKFEKAFAGAVRKERIDSGLGTFNMIPQDF